MRILFAAGGTAGHVNPALAVAETVKKHDSKAVIAFVGKTGGFEKELIEENGFLYYSVRMQGLKRKLSLENFKALALLIKARRRAEEIIRDFRPDLIFSTGGYLAYPFLQKGHRLGIPTLLHEANAVLGLSARMSEKYLCRMLLHWDAARTALRHPERAVTVGMPIRHFPTETREEIRRRLHIPRDAALLLSFGGSLGAEALNDAMASLLSSPALERNRSLYVIHGTGKREYDRFLARYGEKADPRIRIFSYIKDIPAVMKAADLVVSRAGAGTLSELSATGTPAILIPSPHVTDNHQMKNAEVLLRAGGVRIIAESALSGESLTNAVLSLLADREARKSMRNALLSLNTAKSEKSSPKI